MKHCRASGLCRVSMSVACAAALFSSACVDDAPEYPPRTQIPPFIVFAQVSPSPSEVYENGVPMDIDVPFRSEDENEDLTALFVVDLLPGATTFQVEGRVPVAASTYDDTSRSVEFTWSNTRTLRGCRSLTMVLTYDSNLEGNQPIDESRTARVVWWMALDDPQTVPLRSCPRSN